MEELWVFGYGSLMWRPGFEYEESQQAKLYGLHRRLCIYSYVHRGTRDRPGLVLGLDRGGSCQGVAFRVSAQNREAVYQYLHEREMMNYAYHETYRKLFLADGRVVTALTYCAVREHEQYAPRMELPDMLKRICGAVGQSGANEDYVLSTVEKINAIGARDKGLEVIAKALKAV